MKTATEMSLLRLITAAGAAHGTHEAIELKGVYDEEWADWYGTYLLKHGLREILPDTETLDPALLGAVLTRLDVDHRRDEPATAWPNYYAERFVAMVDEVRSRTDLAIGQPGHPSNLTGDLRTL